MLKTLDWLLNGATAVVIALMVAAAIHKYCHVPPWTLGIMLGVVGLALYVASGMLVHAYISKRAPEFANDTLWDMTAGTGIVPKWVSLIGLMSIPVLVAAAIWLIVWYWAGGPA